MSFDQAVKLKLRLGNETCRNVNNYENCKTSLTIIFPFSRKTSNLHNHEAPLPRTGSGYYPFDGYLMSTVSYTLNTLKTRKKRQIFIENYFCNSMKVVRKLQLAIGKHLNLA